MYQSGSSYKSNFHSNSIHLALGEFYIGMKFLGSQKKTINYIYVLFYGIEKFISDKLSDTIIVDAENCYCEYVLNLTKILNNNFLFRDITP